MIANSKDSGDLIKITKFQVIQFYDKIEVKQGNRTKLIEKPIIIMYGLGEDGIVYEMTAGKWLALPVNAKTVKTMEMLEKEKETNVRG